MTREEFYQSLEVMNKAELLEKKSELAERMGMMIKHSELFDREIYYSCMYGITKIEAKLEGLGA